MPIARAAFCARPLLAAALALGVAAETSAQGAAQAAVPRDRPASAQALLDSQSEEVVQELLDERLVLMKNGGGDASLVEALVLFSVPPDQVWKLLVQRERQSEYRPELTEIKVIESEEGRLLEEQHLRIAFISLSYRLENRFDPETRTLAFEIDERYESVIQHVSGYWELHALDGGRTLARFGTRVNVSSAVPGFLQNGITRKNVPNSLENTRQWVDSGGRWRP
jgi:ribosome-associated toxin RatA of RatAB toxin-antitoxin module